MSYDIHIPCNCHKENKINIPPFFDKLELDEGIYCPKYEFDTLEFEKEYDKWTFCEHNQYALIVSMAQSVQGWKFYIKENYPNRFINLVDFFPDFNGYFNPDYSKSEALKELNQFRILEDSKYQERFDQFEKLLKTAIELDQEIYWG